MVSTERDAALDLVASIVLRALDRQRARERAADALDEVRGPE